jgi:hypothetical protein
MGECGRARIHDFETPKPNRDSSPVRCTVTAPPLVTPAVPPPVTNTIMLSPEQNFLLRIEKWLGPVLFHAEKIAVTWSDMDNVNWATWYRPITDFLTNRQVEKTSGKHHYAEVLGFFILRARDNRHDAVYPLQLLLQRLIFMRRRADYRRLEHKRDLLMKFLEKDIIPDLFLSLLEDHIVCGSPFVEVDSISPTKLWLYYEHFFSSPAITNETWAVRFRMYERKPGREGFGIRDNH